MAPRASKKRKRPSDKDDDGSSSPVGPAEGGEVELGGRSGEHGFPTVGVSPVEELPATPGLNAVEESNCRTCTGDGERSSAATGFSAFPAGSSMTPVTAECDVARSSGGEEDSSSWRRAASSRDESAVLGTGQEDMPGKMTVRDAELFIGAVPEKVLHCVCNAALDVHEFAKEMVSTGTKALQLVASGEEAGAGGELEVVQRLVRLLLGGTETGSAGDSREKLRAQELQLLFRMEIICAFQSVWQEEHGRLLDEVCDLLDTVQFTLDVVDGESLMDYAERVIGSRYSGSMPEVVKQIFTQMEFLGFNDELGDMDVPNTVEAVPTQECSAETEIPISDWQASAPSLKASIKKSLSGNTKVPLFPREMPGVPVAAQIRKDVDCSKQSEDECQRKRERARRLSHFGKSRAVEALKKISVLSPLKRPKSLVPSQRRKRARHMEPAKADVVPGTPLVFHDFARTIPETPVACHRKITILETPSASHSPRRRVLETPLVSRRNILGIRPTGSPDVVVMETPASMRNCGETAVSGTRRPLATNSPENKHRLFLKSKRAMDLGSVFELKGAGMKPASKTTDSVANALPGNSSYGQL